MRRRSVRSLLAALALGGALAAAPAKVATELEIRGQVVTPDGRGAAGAQVALAPLPADFERGAQQARGIWQPEPVARVRADAQGRFSVTAPAPGMWQVTITAAGYLPVNRRLAGLLAPVDLPRAQLVPAGTLAIEVVDAAGQPRPGALVRALNPSPQRLRRGMFNGWATAERLAAADSRGALELARATDEELTLWAWAPGCREVKLEAVKAGPVRIELRPAPERLVEVHAAGGVAVSGVVMLAGEGRWAVARSDEHGRLRVPVASTLKVQLLAADGARLAAEVTPPAAGEAPAPLVLELPPALVVSGGVIDEASRRGISGALVWPDSDPGAGVTTGPDGSYRLTTSGPRGTLRITAAAAGYLTDSGDTGSNAGPTLALVPAQAASGVVVNREGRPVADAQVNATGKPARGRGGWNGPWNGPVLARSDAEGRFQLRNLVPDASYDLQVSAAEYAQARLELVTSAAAPPLRIVLERGRRAFGAVVDGDGQPLAGAEVELQPQSSGRPGMRFLALIAGRDDAAKVTTGADGRFELLHVPAGRYDLTASAPGFAPTRVRGLELPAEEGTSDLGTVYLEPGAVLQGRVTDTQKVPLEGVAVQVVPAGQGLFPQPADDQPALTAADGFFELSDLRASERVDLVFQRTGYQQLRLPGVDVSSPEPLEVQLAPASRVSGRGVDQDQEPVAGARMLLASGEGPMFRGFGGRGGRPLFGVADELGDFVLEDVPPGSYRLTTTATGFQLQEAAVEVPAGRDLENLTVVLAPGAVLEGRVLTPDGRPVQDASVRQVSNAQNPLRWTDSVASDADGHYRLEGLETGSQSIEATHPDYRRVVRDLDVREGVNSLDLVLARGLEISGQVVDSAGTGLGGVTVRARLRGPNPQGQNTTSSADGSFVVSGLSEGSYSLDARKEGYATAQLDDLQLQAASLTGLQLVLGSGGRIYGQVLGLDFDALAQVQILAVNRAAAGFAEAAVDFEGSYRLDNLAPGTWMVVAEVEAQGRQANASVQLEAGEEQQVDLQFTDGVRLSGHVTRGQQPVVGARVILARVDGTASGGTGETDYQGAFQIQGLEAGRYRLQVADFATGLDYGEEVELDGDREMEIDIPLTGISGRVVDAASGAPVEGATVQLSTKEAPSSVAGFRPGRGSSRLTGADGSFRFESVLDGSWRLVADKDGYGSADLDVDLQPGDSLDGVELRLQATEGLVLDVRLPSGQPAQMVSAAVLNGAGQVLTSETQRTGEGGRIRLGSAPAGAWEVLVSAEGSATTSLQATVPGPILAVQVPAAGSLQVTIPELQQTSGASLRLAAPDGRPYRSVDRGGVREEWPVYFGQLRLEGIPAGTWTLTVLTPDERVLGGSATVVAGATGQFVLE